MRFAYQNVSVKIVSSQKGLSLVLGHINTLLDALIRLTAV